MVRRPALNWFRPNLGRSEAGGEDSMRFPVSVFRTLMQENIPDIHIPRGEHLFDDELILIKNKNKN